MAHAKKCPECGKKMIKTGNGVALCSYPPIYPQKWWCGCGHEEPATAIRGQTSEEMQQKQWELANA